MSKWGASHVPVPNLVTVDFLALHCMFPALVWPLHSLPEFEHLLTEDQQSGGQTLPFGPLPLG